MKELKHYNRAKYKCKYCKETFLWKTTYILNHVTKNHKQDLIYDYGSVVNGVKQLSKTQTFIKTKSVSI